MIDDTSSTLQYASLFLTTADAASGDVVAAAITEIVRLILELTSTNASIDYRNGLRIRLELERGLTEAEQTFAALPDGPARAEALHRLDGLRTIAGRQLAIAPAPSAAAMAAADAGDPSALDDDADQWTASRLGHVASQPRPARRPHSDTRPESACAIGANRANDPALLVPATPAAADDLTSNEAD